MKKLIAARNLLAVIAAVSFVAGCAGTHSADAGASKSMTHTIVLAAPTDSERNAVRPSSKGAPLQVGFGRDVPVAQRRVVLRDLQWQAIPGGYTASISVQSTGARSLRVALRLNKNVPGLECGFRGASTVPAAALVNAGSDPYWSPVIDGDTVWIDFKATTPPPSDVVFELPLVSHIS